LLILGRVARAEQERGNAQGIKSPLEQEKKRERWRKMFFLLQASLKIVLIVKARDCRTSWLIYDCSAV